MPDTNLGWDRLPIEDSGEGPDDSIQPPPQDDVPYAPPAADRPPSWTQVATQNPSPPPRWGSAEEMRYARKTAGLRQVLDNLDEGVVHEQYARPLIDQFHADLGALDQQKAAAQGLQQQQATQAALAARATERAVEQQDMQHRAAFFQHTMHRYVNPDTGEATDFYQKKPGEWEPIPKKDQTDVGSAYPEGAAGGVEDYQQTAAGDQGQQPFTQTIYNGPNRTDTTWQPGQTLGQSSGSWMGQPGGRPPQQAAPAGGQHYEEAKKILGQPPPQFFIGAHGQRLPNPQFAAYQRAATALALDFYKTDRQASSQNEHQRQEQVRADREKARQDQREKGVLWDSVYKDRLDKLQKEWDRIRTGPDGHPKDEGDIKDRPEWAKDRESMEAEAETRADRDYLRAHGHLPAAREKAAKPGESPAAAPATQPNGPPPQKPAAAAPKVEPLPKEKYTDAEIQAEIARRQRARQAPLPRPDPNPSTGFRTISKFD